jgi:hypothetical protein
MTRQICAAFDDDGVYVYQAFKSSTVAAALKKGTFGDGFSLERMTWIKPSFGWMLYRSGYATKPQQESILKIKLSHEGFKIILQQAVGTLYNPLVYSSEDHWRERLTNSGVRYQWDPDRYLNGDKHSTRRAIQIGLKGPVVRHYVDDWIIGLEDVTELAHSIKQAIDNDLPIPDVPKELIYPLADEIKHHLGNE